MGPRTKKKNLLQDAQRVSPAIQSLMKAAMSFDMAAKSVGSPVLPTLLIPYLEQIQMRLRLRRGEYAYVVLVTVHATGHSHVLFRYTSHSPHNLARQVCDTEQKVFVRHREGQALP